jgi:hypothetical protein
MRAPSPRRGRPREHEPGVRDRRGHYDRAQLEPTATSRACELERSDLDVMQLLVGCRSRRTCGRAMLARRCLSKTRRNHGMETTRHKVATRTRPGTGSPRVPWIEGACRKCATTTSAARTDLVQTECAPAQSLSFAHTSRAALRHNACANGSVPDHVMHGLARPKGRQQLASAGVHTTCDR